MFLTEWKAILIQLRRSYKMKEKMRVAVIGCGRFAKNFVPLFKAHPVVEKVYVCDLDKSRAEDYSQKFDVDINFKDINKPKNTLSGSGIRVNDESESKLIEVTWIGD